ncbi:MAG: hypothetical protein AAGI90_04160 [Chlamydiota bacterium]
MISAAPSRPATPSPTFYRVWGPAYITFTGVTMPKYLEQIFVLINRFFYILLPYLCKSYTLSNHLNQKCNVLTATEDKNEPKFHIRETILYSLLSVITFFIVPILFYTIQQVYLWKCPCFCQKTLKTKLGTTTANSSDDLPPEVDRATTRKSGDSNDMETEESESSEESGRSPKLPLEGSQITHKGVDREKEALREQNRSLIRGLRIQTDYADDLDKKFSEYKQHSEDAFARLTSQIATLSGEKAALETELNRQEEKKPDGKSEEKDVPLEVHADDSDDADDALLKEERNYRAARQSLNHVESLKRADRLVAQLQKSLDTEQKTNTSLSKEKTALERRLDDLTDEYHGLQKHVQTLSQVRAKNGELLCVLEEFKNIIDTKPDLAEIANNRMLRVKEFLEGDEKIRSSSQLRRHRDDREKSHSPVSPKSPLPRERALSDLDKLRLMRDYFSELEKTLGKDPTLKEAVTKELTSFTIEENEGYEEWTQKIQKLREIAKNHSKLKELLDEHNKAFYGNNEGGPGGEGSDSETVVHLGRNADSRAETFLTEEEPGEGTLVTTGSRLLGDSESGMVSVPGESLLHSGIMSREVSDDTKSDANPFNSRHPLSSPESKRRKTRRLLSSGSLAPISEGKKREGEN